MCVYCIRREKTLNVHPRVQDAAAEATRQRPRQRRQSRGAQLDVAREKTDGAAGEPRAEGRR